MKGEKGKAVPLTGACGHPVIPVTYQDDFTGNPLPRLRCVRCGITYLPKGGGK